MALVSPKAPPNHHLAAVHLNRGAWHGEIGDQEHAARLVRPIRDLVGTIWAAWEEDAVSGLEVALAVGSAERRGAGDDDEQLVVSKLIVVWERTLAWPKLEETGTEVVSRDPLPTPSKTWLLSRRRSLHPALVPEQIHLHAAKSRTVRS
jgi:hypothetical protein